ncbi:PP2C family protein-serine/threonine phosphatase [Streptomyces sp. NPDC102406]|uniref:PP2C family protein-serine/threonine phosphatase n=1 Tax=Streptomyces sp. NPDC102406 TaxID=3366171 RepID=UPI0038218FCB
MSPHVFADRPPGQPPERGTVDALISQTRRLLGDVDAVRREATGPTADGTDPEARWQRALYELAVHQLNDLDRHLAQLRDGPATRATPPPPRSAAQRQRGSLLSRVGSAEWNLLTDEATWSEELYRILGRDPDAPALTLDELPALVHREDQPMLTAMVTDCLIDGKPIDGEFRVVRPDESLRTVHMMGEPVLDADGSTASMWAVVRDVSELRRSQRAVSETRDSLQRQRHIAQTEHRLAVELQEAVLPPWRGSLRLPRSTPDAPDTTDGLDVAARHLPSFAGAPSGGDWYDVAELPDGRVQLTAGTLTGHGVAVASAMAMLLGAVRAMALCDTAPDDLLSRLNDLHSGSPASSPAAAVCCRYDPAARTLAWAQAGHPPPLLFRDGAGRALTSPEGAALGAASRAGYGQAEETLRPGDVLVLHTDDLTARLGRNLGRDRLLALAPALTTARGAQECLRVIVDAFGAQEREDDACVLVAQVAGG